MPEPAYIGSGTSPRNTDTRLVRWTKMLGRYQNLDGADPTNNPKRTDTLRRIKLKLLRAITNAS
jgi:hypothetical protein